MEAINLDQSKLFVYEQMYNDNTINENITNFGSVEYLEDIRRSL